MVNLSLAARQTPSEVIRGSSRLAAEAALPSVRPAYQLARVLGDKPDRLRVLAPLLEGVVRAAGENAGRLSDTELHAGVLERFRPTSDTPTVTCNGCWAWATWAGIWPTCGWWSHTCSTS